MRLAQKLRFLAGDVETYVAELKRRSLYHTLGDSIKALEQSAGIAASVLRESDPGDAVRSELALWKDAYAELESASSLLVRTVNDTLRHGLTQTARAKLDESVCAVAPLLKRGE